MYANENLPFEWKHVPFAWKKEHATYEYILWTDQTLRELVATDYPGLLDTYDAYTYPTQRWDAARYCILHKYGGVYVDLDISPAKSITNILRGHELILPYTSDGGLTNAFMASTRNHPFFESVIRDLPRYSGNYLPRHFQILTSTGPTFLWASYMRWSRKTNMSSALLPSKAWGKCSYCTQGSEENPYFVHGKGSSWHASDSQIILELFCRIDSLVAFAAVVFYTLGKCRHVMKIIFFAMLHNAMGNIFLEALIARPFVWAIMS